MPDTKEPAVRPLIDDRYWFEFSKEMVQSAPSCRNEAATKLQTLIVWLWGIYTASATVGIALSKTSYPTAIILLIASPSAILILAYWAAAWVQMPIQAEFDPRMPKDIKEAYLKGVKAKNRRLNFSIFLSFLSSVLVAFAIFAASMSKQETPPNFQAYHHEKEGHDSIAFSGNFPANAKVVLRIKTFPPSDGPSTPTEFLYVTSPLGALQTSITLDAAAKYEVTAEWKEVDGLVRCLTRTVLPENRK